MGVPDYGPPWRWLGRLESGVWRSQALRGAYEAREASDAVNGEHQSRELDAGDGVNFLYHAQILGYLVKPFEWPDGEVW